MGGRRRAARPRLLLHQQLAARTAGRQRAHRGHPGVERAVPDGPARGSGCAVRRLRPVEPEAGLARLRGPHAGVQAARGGRGHPRAAGHGVVLLRRRPHVPCPGAAGRRDPALPVGPDQLLRLRPRPAAALQPGPHLARAAVSAVDRRLVPGRGHLPDPLRLRPRAETPALAGLRSARCPGRRGGRHDRRLGPERFRRRVGRGLTVLGPAVGVPGPAQSLAGHARGGAVPVDRHHLPRHPRPSQDRAPDQHAVAVLLRRTRHPGLLRRRHARRHRDAPDRRRLLAVLGGAPVGGGLPRAVHHRHGRLHLRHAGRGAAPDRHRHHLPRRHPVLRRWGAGHHAPPVLLRHPGGAHGPRRVLLRAGGHPGPRRPSRTAGR